MDPADLERLERELRALLEHTKEYAIAAAVLLALTCVWIAWDAKKRGLRISGGGWTAIILLWPFSIIGYPAWRARRLRERRDASE